MKKIVFVPLDERPCTYDYPNELAALAAKDISFKEVPREIMGAKKTPGNTKAIAEYVYQECLDADCAVIAIDTLLYGGIVPSRLHYDNEETLLARLDLIAKIKAANPKIKIFAYHLIMRCPSYSSDDEEPDYYEWCGRQIHMLGVYEHLKEIRKLTDEEEKDYESMKKFMEEHDYYQYQKDYLERRKINAIMNIHTLDYVKNGMIDFLVVPQDDSAPYGLTAKDQMIVRKAIADKHLELKAIMYPEADAAGQALLARAINEVNQKKPKIFVRYNTCNNGNIIPNFEDRPLSESVKYQIMAAGGMTTYSSTDADIVLMINCPLKDMVGIRQLYDALKSGVGETDLNYTVGRNMVEYIEYIKYLISIDKCVAVADLAYSNGGDTVLFNLLKTEGLLFKVGSYAGWNTSANTLGTCIPLAMTKNIYGPSEGFYNSLGARYLEDVGYQSNVRFDAFDKFKDQFNWGLIDGKENGTVATYIRNGLIAWAKENLCTDEYEVTLVKHYQPWNRFFETGITVKTTIKK